LARTLYRGGQALTDIDAVGLQGNRLLLVSCKSTAFTIPALRGEFAITRNLTQKTHEAADDWRAVLEAVRGDPAILGHEVESAAPSVDGCVVFPSVPFFMNSRWRHQRAFNEVPFLCSVSELRRVLTVA
jgi:hypothetical protein